MQTFIKVMVQTFIKGNGNVSMFGFNAGKQCVPCMSIYAILYNEIKSVNIWDTSLMNTALINGTIFIASLVNMFKKISCCSQRYLRLFQLRRILFIWNTVSSFLGLY